MIDNIRLQNYENSMFIIKPDAYFYREDILKLLLNKFRLVEIKDVILTEHFLNELYKNENVNFKNMNVQYLTGKKAIIGIVSAPNCKQELFEICGEDYRPEKCKPNTIRYKFNVCPEPINLNGDKFYINAIHRASPKDADREIELYREEYINYRKNYEEDKIIIDNGR